MKTHHPDNARIKHKYLGYLKEAKGHAEASLDSVAQALDRFETYTHQRRRGFTPAAAQKKPNVVMLMTDDTGWNDFGAYSGGGAALGHPTPNIDRIAKEGATFTIVVGIAPCSVELCEAVVAVNDVKRPSQFGQERDCLSPFRSERQARTAMQEVACKL